MRKNFDAFVAAPVMLASILALGMTCAWIAIMAFPTSLVEPWLPDFMVRSVWLIFGALLSPLMVSITAFIYAPLKGGWPLQTASHPYVFVPLFLLVALSIGLAIRTYYRHGRVSETGALGWAVFVAVWGVPGFIGYLAHRRWPVVERCTSCGKDTPRDRDDCLYCHAPFPPPAHTGTEIFA